MNNNDDNVNNRLIFTEPHELNLNNVDINNTEHINNKKQTHFTATTTNNNPSIHIHRPVPKSKLQKAEDKYFSLKEEINSHILSTSPTPLSNVQLLTYLEKLNTVLSDVISIILYLIYFFTSFNIILFFITNTKLTNRQNARLRRAQQEPPGVPDQGQLNDNNQKLSIVYKKQYFLLKAKLDRVAKEDFLLKLEQERKAIDNELNVLRAETKRLQNEQKLNDIALSKMTKGNNRGEIELKRLVMDYESLKRQKVSIVNKLNQKKQLYEDGSMKLSQLNEFHERLENIAKDMYHITEYGNVKDEEMNVKKKEKFRKSLIYKINILDKAITSNQKRFISESKLNMKKIMELRIQKEMMVEKYVQTGGKYEEEDHEDREGTERDYQEEVRKTEQEEVNKEDKEAVLKEIEELFMERDKERDKCKTCINEMSGGNKEYIEDRKVLVENEEEDKVINSDDKDKDDHGGNENEEYAKNDGVEDMLVTQNDKGVENDNKIMHKHVPEFLEGFGDSKVNVIQSDHSDKAGTENNNNELQISHKAVKERKQKIEIIQKESKEINTNGDHTKQIPAQFENEYEDLEEFQI